MMKRRIWLISASLYEVYYAVFENKLKVKQALTQLIMPNVDSAEYRMAFSELGSELGILITEKYPDLGNVLLVCASEDADWLAKGLIDSLHHNIGLAVLWSNRITICQDPKIEVSEINKSYVDIESDTCDTMIVVKSIISTSCVVKSQLNYLVKRVNPQKIIIAAPVMFVSAKESLMNEYPASVSSKFKFLTFAIDDVRDDKGVVLPGVGGMVYPKLGLGNQVEKNSYMLQIVRDRVFASLRA